MTTAKNRAVGDPAVHDPQPEELKHIQRIENGNSPEKNARGADDFREPDHPNALAPFSCLIFAFRG